MKFRFFTLLLVMVAFAFNGYATNPISPEAVDFEKTVKVEKQMNKATKLLAKFSQSKVGKWVAKKAVKVMNFAQKLGIDLNDPVEKWLWYAIIGIIAGTVVYISGWFFTPLWYLGYLIYLAGVISFWYWVYLKFLK